MELFRVSLPHTFIGFIFLSTVTGAVMDDPVGFSEGGGTLQQTACSCCARGDPGQPGVPGPQGPTGLPGHQGVPGLPGNPGSHGTNGIPGLHGEKGSTGLPGPVGPMGEPGPKGALGKIGPQGQRGPRGHDGVPGVPGPDGTVGMKGEKGQKGDSGDTGTIYWPESRPYHVHHSQSAFSAACSSEVQAKPIEDTVLLFDTIFVNVGNDFDSARGTYHCRINGTYYFIVHANKWSNQNDLFLKLMKNGEMKIGIYEDAGYDYYDMASNSLLLHLVEGDRVWLQLHTNDRVYGGLSRMTTFSGWLLYEDPIL